jgi:EmrB/QacA subfamily drug resistance transporter
MKTAETSYKWKAMALVALSTIMGAVDFSFVNLSMPTLAKTFNSELSTVVWLNLTWADVLVCLGPVLGKMNDLVGRKRVFLVGAGFMTAGLIGCSLSATMGQLILFRVVNAIGNAMTMTCHAAIVTDAFPREERGRGLGLQNASLSLGFILGPLVGGALLSWLDWRSIYYVRVPAGIIMFFMALAILKGDSSTATKARFDIAGTMTSASGLLSLILGVSFITQHGLQSPLVWVLVLGGFLLLILFVVVEKRVSDPIIDISLFRNSAFLGGVLSLLVFWIAVQGFALTIPFYLGQARAMAFSSIGLLFTVGSMASFIASPVSGFLSDRVKPAALSAIGAAIYLGALILWSNFGLHTSILFAVIAFVVGGSGSGTFLSANSTAVMAAVRPEQHGAASALLASVTGLSLSLGMAWASTVYSMRKALHHLDLLKRGTGEVVAFSKSIDTSFHETIIVSICFQCLVVVCALLPLMALRRSERTGASRSPG